MDNSSLLLDIFPDRKDTVEFLNFCQVNTCGDLYAISDVDFENMVKLKLSTSSRWINSRGPISRWLNVTRQEVFRCLTPKKTIGNNNIIFFPN
jgi:hypothetical protein